MTIRQQRPARLAILAALGLLVSALPAQADMALDPAQSTVTLLSTKVLADGSDSVVERHSFQDLSGQVGTDGAASVTIPLESLETGIPIRNERMAEYLFETATYPEATIEAMVPDELLGNGTHMTELTANLSLHGTTQEVQVPVQVDVKDGSMVVTATEPVLLDATAYDLAGGIGKLAELAKLMHIPTTVPVSFTLTFADGDS